MYCELILALQYDMYRDTIFMHKSQLESFNTLKENRFKTMSEAHFV